MRKALVAHWLSCITMAVALAILVLMYLEVVRLSSIGAAQTPASHSALPMALTLEQSTHTLLHQHRSIVWLVGLQIALLVFSAWLQWSGRRQVLQQEALKRHATDLAAANQRSEMANRGKSMFLANMSHELRTPLNGVLGMLGLLQGTRVDAVQSDYIQSARNAARHLLGLLNEVLDMSSLEAGKMTLKPSLLHLPGLLAEIEGFARPLVRAKGLQFLVSVDKNLPAWVSMDETRLKQILMNLLTNAVKFSDTGTIRLEVQLEGSRQPLRGETAVVHMAVVDQGIGMDEAMCARLFQRFEQGDASSSRRFEGTGLGLEISRNLARLMHGDIAVKSSLNQGSTFSVHLKMLCAEPPAPMPVSDEYMQTAAIGLDIVVAEDNATNRKFMAALLERMGHQVRFAEDGEQAVALVHQRVPNLVLMDMHMPVMDGVLATRTIRASSGSAAKVPIIALTADVMGDIRDRAFAAGIDGFMTKPLDTEALQKKLMELFPQKDPPNASASPAPAAGRAAATTMRRHTKPPMAPRYLEAPYPGTMQAQLNMHMVGEVCRIAGADGFQEMVQEFAVSDSGNLAQLINMLAHGPVESLEALAHSVKGEAATLGLTGISQAAESVEGASAHLTPEQREQARQQLAEAWDVASNLLECLGFLKETPSAALPSGDVIAQALQPVASAAADPSTAALLQIIYSSTLRQHASVHLQDIHAASMRNNLRTGITGMLLCADGQILQVLEGPSDAVLATYQRIVLDKRHQDLLLIVEKPLDRREFSDWSSGVCREESRSGTPSAHPFFGDRALDLKTMVRPGLALDVLQAFSSRTMGIY